MVCYVYYPRIGCLLMNQAIYTFTGLLLLSSLISMESNLYVLLYISESRASCYIFPYHPELLIFHWTVKEGGLQFTPCCAGGLYVLENCGYFVSEFQRFQFFFFLLMKREWRGPTRHGDLLRPPYFSAVSVYLSFTLIIRLRLYSCENLLICFDMFSTSGVRTGIEPYFVELLILSIREP